MLRGVVTFVDHSRDDGFRRTDRRSVTSWTGCVFDVRGSLLPGLVRPVAVVMFQVLAEHKDQVAFAEDQGTVQQLPAEWPDYALADGVHPWQQHPEMVPTTPLVPQQPQPTTRDRVSERDGRNNVHNRWMPLAPTARIIYGVSLTYRFGVS